LRIANSSRLAICNSKFAGESVKITNLKGIIVLGFVVMILSACSSSAPSTATIPTRVATQTPWIIYVPVTVTPEPATITPLPTVEVRTTPTRTPTRAVASVRATATATKPAAPSTPVVAAATPVPACNLGTVTPYFPENGVRRTINIVGTGGPAFEFKWHTPLGAGQQDPTIGYRIDITSKRGGQTVGGDTVYVSHNKYIERGMYSYEGPKVRRLGAGDSAAITWYVTIVKVSGGFNDDGTKNGTEISCGSPSQTMLIDLYFE
jgi:hypothetical protein